MKHEFQRFVFYCVGRLVTASPLSQVLDATESTLHKIMRQRHLALTKTMKEVPEDTERAQPSNGGFESIGCPAEFTEKVLASFVLSLREDFPVHGWLPYIMLCNSLLVRTSMA
eukprot:2697149-Amphidinium_carterae.1